jgi:hypothetical protein
VAYIRVSLQIKSDKTKKSKEILGGMRKLFYLSELDLGHASKQIGKHKKPAKVTRVYAKIGEVCELDPGHSSNQIRQQQKINVKTLNFAKLLVRNFAKTLFAKFRGISRNFAKLLVRNVAKFREINFNFVLIFYFAK